MTKRPTKVICVLGALLTLTACGQAKAGTALPKSDDAANYVGAKFEQTMNKLETTIVSARDVTNSTDAYFRFDDKYVHSVISSARTGNPESRVSRNRSIKNPDESLDTFEPGDGAVEYLHLGPVYKSLAPTPWVSMPKADGGLIQPCVWEGVLSACKMADAVDDAYNADKRAVRGAKSMGEGKTALTVNVPFSVFLDNRVEVLPDSMLAQVGDELKKAQIPATITLNPDGSLVTFLMEAKFEGDGHKLELRYEFKFTGKATTQDLPATPDVSQVTALPDDAAKKDFYRRLGEAQGN